MHNFPSFFIKQSFDRANARLFTYRRHVKHAKSSVARIRIGQLAGTAHCSLRVFFSLFLVFIVKRHEQMYETLCKLSVYSFSFSVYNRALFRTDVRFCISRRLSVLLPCPHKRARKAIGKRRQASASVGKPVGKPVEAQGAQKGKGHAKRRAIGSGNGKTAVSASGESGRNGKKKPQKQKKGKPQAVRSRNGRRTPCRRESRRRQTAQDKNGGLTWSKTHKREPNTKAKNTANAGSAVTERVRRSVRGFTDARTG